jgi:iron complex transport system substrate-binding protein
VPHASFGALLTSLVLVLAACSGAATTSVAPSPSAVAVATVAPTLAPTPTAAPTPVPTPAPAFPVTLTDDEGTAVTLKAEPKKIVSLTPAATETLFALGAGPRVIAATAFDDYPPAAVALPDVATFTSVDVEKIVGMEADLVVAGGNFFNPPEAIKSLRSLGVPVLVVYAPDLAGALKDIALLGAAVGRPGQAAAITTMMQADFDAVGAATTGLSKPRTFYEIDVSTGPIYTVADGSVYVEMITLAGGTPITTGSKTDYAIPLEKLIEADPELILLGDAAYKVTAEQVKARPGWNVMTAVKNGAIWPIDDITVTRPGPRLVEGLRALALAIHPDVALPPAPQIPAVP